MAHRVGVVGASGYGGTELLRLLAAHPAMEVATVAAHGHAGSPVTAVAPNLGGDDVFSAVDADELAGLDLVFLSVPHEAALPMVPALTARGVKVVDLSAAYRLTGAAFAHWYGGSHPQPGTTPATYGLTEWARSDIATAATVANPGCYPTATLLGVLPVAHLVEAGSVVITAMSGSSGAGRGLKPHLHHPNLDGNVVPYGAPDHRHTGEIEHWMTALSGRDLGPVSFTPHLVPIARGLLATIHAQLIPDVTSTDVTAALADRYASEAFVSVLPGGTFPETKSLHGSNGCHIGAVVDPRTGRVVLTTAIDNLGKGAAGQAIQNANLMLGVDEGTGLTAVGVYP